MASLSPLPPGALRKSTNPADLPFETTDELPDLTGFLGQERALHAVDLGVRMRHQGYNIFAFGAAGTGKLSLVRTHVEEQARVQEPPSDWCYVNRFDAPGKPRALRLPPGMGKVLRADMQHFADELRTALSSAFESEEIQARRQSLAEEFQERQQASLASLQEKAHAAGLTLLRSANGLTFAPFKEGEVIAPEAFEKLPKEEKEQISKQIDLLQEELQRSLYKVPAWERELRKRMRDLHREVTTVVLASVMDDLLDKYNAYGTVIEWLGSVQHDVIEHVLELFSEEGKGGDGPSPVQGFLDGRSSPRRYEVNLLVNAEGAQGAPVIYESNPTYGNLMGRVEHQAQMGMLTTDHTLIKAGCLHRANGGYLLLDAQRVLTAPYSWEALKRALQYGQIRIESPAEMLSATATISLEPEPIPLNVKVVLMGEPTLYFMISSLDPDFNELFKVSADFEDELDRTAENVRLYTHLIATIARRDGLRPFARDAVARLIDESARLAEDSERLTARIADLQGLMQEADHWAGEERVQGVKAIHVQRAVESRLFRLNRMEVRLRESVLRGALVINITGERVGQINALSVVQLGKHAFGIVSRITATVRLGSGEVIDIEREVELGGPIHSKGVLILSSYLRAHYTPDEPLSLAATLVFEQSYGGVEGDSASSTELYALLSAIAGAPIRQGLAVTGSVNQFGEIQAIGGVNEKIEGFFDLCAARGLTGDQGVLIPATNVMDLMLRDDVVEAVRAGRFAVYAVETVAQGIELLTGLPAGEAGADGNYPEGSFNRRVLDRLKQLTEARKRADAEGLEEKGADKLEPEEPRPPRKRRPRPVPPLEPPEESA